MGFGEILESWDQGKRKEKNAKKKNSEEVASMDEWLNSYAPDSTVLASKEEGELRVSGHSRGKMKRKQADLVLDLHGLVAADAEIELNRFIQRSYKNGARKILIIHGKGNHTDGRPVLKPLVKSILEASPYIGDTGPAERKDGGSGATWALVRQRSL